VATVKAMKTTTTQVHTPAASQATHNDRHQIGLANLRKIEAKAQPAIVDSLADMAPDLARLAIDFVYGDIYSRPHLSLRDRQLITVAALAALGHARPQLKFHIAGALNVGCTPTELVELMMHLVVYAGFPTGLNGVFAAREVFQERGVVHQPQALSPPTQTAQRYAMGWEALARIDGHAGEQVIAALADVAPDLGRFIIEFGFGDIYTRPLLGLVERELITVAALTAMGTAAPQLKVHVHGLLNVGGSREQLVEAVLHTAAYAGFPAAINAMLLAQEVWVERAAASTTAATTAAAPPPATTQATHR
jgi:4-carboxymuconolactone decarboxylase